MSQPTIEYTTLEEADAIYENIDDFICDFSDDDLYSFEEVRFTYLDFYMKELEKHTNAFWKRLAYKGWARMYSDYVWAMIKDIEVNAGNGPASIFARRASEEMFNRGIARPTRIGSPKLCDPAHATFETVRNLELVFAPTEE